ncbi:transcriptional regulator with XRE-family HTH domain [Kibdelosporangium banguiense]|uniref:Transcriptional regulator with XRE-family HTH domain n=1 Tax=Kibdelosporangium banguiense TaxID=1365924 RepID=A0ABS4TEM6_9PSEU|nr:helix-turn-helix transcriptional regulator [Kibdelosporangium banguiense]MBP2322855.1 transcriptional regulator with XRE-family HTH domain [Kibdelosporangium banguiense]
MSNELGEFLRSRRARIAPEEVGLPRGERRRVPGLRRDELARLAGVSVEYYTRLEQGRSPNVSDSVLDSIGNALSLNETEREHLRTLVRPTRRARPSPRGAQVRGSVQMVLDQMDRLPAFVLGLRLDVLAWNRLGDAVYGFSALERPNMARMLFLDPKAQEMYPEWVYAAEDTVGLLRWTATRNGNDPQLAALIGELSIHSAEFRRLWAQHDVKEKTFGRKLINHPLVGELDLTFESFSLPAGEPDTMLITYVAVPGSPSADKLAMLGSWSVPEHEVVPAPGGHETLAADHSEE